MRCSHGFLVGAGLCPFHCGEQKKARELEAEKPRRSDPRVEAIAQEVAAELGGQFEAVIAPSVGWSKQGGLTFPIRARAEVVRRAQERLGLTRYQVAQALGIPLKDLSYAVKRCA